LSKSLNMPPFFVLNAGKLISERPSLLFYVSKFMFEAKLLELNLFFTKSVF